MAFSGADRQIGVGDIAARGLGHAQDRLDFLAVDFVALLKAAIQPIEDPRRAVDGVGVAGDGDLVSTGVDGHIHHLLDAGQVAMMGAEQFHGQAVVGKGPFRGFGRDGVVDGFSFHCPGQAVTLSPMVPAPASLISTTPLRLLAWAAVMTRRTMAPGPSMGSST